MSAERQTHRNGYRPRTWETRVGELELLVPRKRSGEAYFPSFLEARRPAEQAIVSVVMEAYVNGVSTRKVDRIVEQLGIGGMTKDRVSALCHALDGAGRGVSRAPAGGRVPLPVARCQAPEGEVGWPHVRSKALVVAYARRRLTSRLTDHPVASLSDCVQMGRAVGLSMSEMQRVTGLARQTLYRQLPPDGEAERHPGRLQASIEVLMLLAAEGDNASPALLARRASMSPSLVTAVLTDLDADRLCTVRRDRYASLEAAPTAGTYLALREHFDDLYLRRPDAISVYVRLPDDHQQAFTHAANAVLAKYEHVVMPQSTAPSAMEGPELAFLVNAPTIRRALAVTRDVWGDVLKQIELDFFEPVIANVIPPGPQPLVGSEVLDVFLEAAVDAGAPNGDALREVRARFSGGLSEAELVGRCATMAALALRRIVGNDHEPRPIVDGDSAFAELQPAHGLPVSQQGSPVKKAAVAALELAADRLGPLPGGRLGSFRAPGQSPRVVNEVRATSSELLEMARLSGEAVGAAAATGKLDAVAATRRVVSSSQG